MPQADESLRVCRIASLTLVNAMIFQQILSEKDDRIQPLSRTICGPNVSESLEDVWKFILEKIDYLPIFSLAHEIIREILGNPGIDNTLRELATAAMRITRRRAALRHDLMGRIYHRLLADAKYFGAFYTTVPAATLLLKLTLDPSQVGIDWSKIDEIRKLRIGDLACGTGTLLKSTLQVIVDNHVRARSNNQELPDLRSVYQVLVEESLWGFDVIPFAIHLAASALAMHEPDVPFRDMNLYTLPLRGGSPVHLGSLDFLVFRRLSVQADLYGSPTGPDRVTGAGEITQPVEVPFLDLCVMNPPFTRSVGGNLLFGNAPKKQRTKMQAELRKIISQKNIFANITAGLGSVFSALGHKLVKAGGHLALVLPRALLSGVAWEQTRQLLGANYHIRYIIVSHEPGAWNFSENTNLSECLIIARRLKNEELAGATKIVNLWTKPKTSIEALTVSELIQSAGGVLLESDKGVEELRTDTQKFGEVILSPPERIKAGQWGEGAAFAQTELCRVAYFLASGIIHVPGRGKLGNIPLITIGSLGTLGPDRRDIHDGFRLAAGTTAYPAFWGHDTESVQCLSQNPNRFLSPLPRASRGRPLRDPQLLWSRAGRVLIAERLRLDTTRVVSIRLDQSVLSNTWWPIAISDKNTCKAEDIERILVLWLNSTLGILSIWAVRVETEGAWIEFKKPILEKLTVLDPCALNARQRKKLIQTYENLSQQNMLHLPAINQDDVRIQIDSVIMEALGLKEDLSSLRQMISREPLLGSLRAAVR